MQVLPPGTILQRMYIKSRLSQKKFRNFIELGSGNGFLSNLLLERGLSGFGFDLNEGACHNNKVLNSRFIEQGRYEVVCGDFLEAQIEEKINFLISCMVIEHFDENQLDRFLRKCKKVLNPEGEIIILVPGSMKYWGIEDEIAGHQKRYSFECFEKMAEDYNFTVNHCAGLTYPISNWLFPVSNFLVKRNETYKKNFSQKEQTVLSGDRNVLFKTKFPMFLSFFLNELTMYPFHVLQKMFRKNENSMVIYCELRLQQKK